MPKCSSCNKIIVPKENFVKFVCPSCAGVTMVRCRKCREFGRSYKCPKCGFIGP